MATGLGQLRERIDILTSTPVAFAVASLTRSGAVATATTALPHGRATGDYVRIAGATPTAYNGKVKVTVTSTTVFTFAIAGSPTTPATGTMTATYVSDAQAGRDATWRTLASGVAAQVVPRGASERLQAEAIRSQVDYRFRVVARTDVTAQMRALWTPRWPPSADELTLEIHGVIQDDHGRLFMFLECGVAP